MTIELITLNSNGETLAMVPAHAFSWARVQLPDGTLERGWTGERNAGKVRAVLEGMLEDHLLDEPERLHFALQPEPQPGQPVWVAICDRQALRDALSALERAGPAPQRIVPEWAPGAAASPGLWVTGTPDAAHLVWADDHGVNRLPVSHRHTGALAALGDIPAHWEVHADAAVAEMAEALLHRAVQVTSAAQRLQQTAQSEWNLAQFDLARRNPLVTRLAQAAHAVWQAPRWRPARWAAVAFALVQLVGLNVQAWQARATLEQQRAAIRNTLLATFPHVSVVVDAPLQMQRELALLGQASGTASARDLESMLGALGTVGTAGAGTLAGATPTSIEYVPGELRLGGVALSGEKINALDSGLRGLGLTSQMDGAKLLLKTRSAP